MSVQVLEKRVDRIEDVVTKLTDISGDLNKIVAVHDHQIAQHERQMGMIENMLEARRLDHEIKLKDVYETIRAEDKIMLAEVAALRKEANDRHDKINERFTKIEKILWTYMGGFTVVTFCIAYGPNILKFLTD